MTSRAIRDPVRDPLLTPQNSALLIIDYQPIQVSRRCAARNPGINLPFSCATSAP